MDKITVHCQNNFCPLAKIHLWSCISPVLTTGILCHCKQYSWRMHLNHGRPRIRPWAQLHKTNANCFFFCNARWKCLRFTFSSVPCNHGSYGSNPLFWKMCHNLLDKTKGVHFCSTLSTRHPILKQHNIANSFYPIVFIFYLKRSFNGQTLRFHPQRGPQTRS